VSQSGGKRGVQQKSVKHFELWIGCQFGGKRKRGKGQWGLGVGRVRKDSPGVWCLFWDNHGIESKVGEEERIWNKAKGGLQQRESNPLQQSVGGGFGGVKKQWNGSSAKNPGETYGCWGEGALGKLANGLLSMYAWAAKWAQGRVLQSVGIRRAKLNAGNAHSYNIMYWVRKRDEKSHLWPKNTEKKGGVR